MEDVIHPTSLVISPFAPKFPKDSIALVECISQSDV